MTREKYHGFDVSVANVAQQIFWHFLPHKQNTSAVNEYFNTARIASQHATHIVKKVPEPQGLQGGADLRFISPQPDTRLHCETMDTGLMHCAVCLFTSQLSLVLVAPTHRGMARLS